VWHVGTIGNVQWMRSPEDLLSRNDDNPLWINTRDGNAELTDVDAIAVQGQWSSLEDGLWKMDSLQTAIKVFAPRRNQLGYCRQDG
jgi:hypothetical protein